MQPLRTCLALNLFHIPVELKRLSGYAFPLTEYKEVAWCPYVLHGTDVLAREGRRAEDGLVGIFMDLDKYRSLLVLERSLSALHSDFRNLKTNTEGTPTLISNELESLWYDNSSICHQRILISDKS